MSFAQLLIFLCKIANMTLFEWDTLDTDRLWCRPIGLCQVVM